MESYLEVGRFCPDCGDDITLDGWCEHCGKRWERRKLELRHSVRGVRTYPRGEPQGATQAVRQVPAPVRDRQEAHMLDDDEKCDYCGAVALLHFFITSKNSCGKCEGTARMEAANEAVRIALKDARHGSHDPAMQ